MERYKHNKTGNMYIKIDEAINATNGDSDGKRMVIYRKDLCQSKDWPIYVREMDEFYEKFTCVDREPTWEV